MIKTEEGDVILIGERPIKDLSLDITYEHERVGEKDDSGWEKHEVASKTAYINGGVEIPFEIVVNGDPSRYVKMKAGGPEFDIAKIRRVVEEAIKEAFK